MTSNTEDTMPVKRRDAEAAWRYRQGVVADATNIADADVAFSFRHNSEQPGLACAAATTQL